MSKQLRDYLPLEQKPGKYIKYLGLTLLFCSLITVISFVNSHREWVSYCIRERITQVGYFAEAFPEIIYYGGTIPQFSEILRGHLLIFVLYFGECISLITGPAVAPLARRTAHRHRAEGHRAAAYRVAQPAGLPGRRGTILPDAQPYEQHPQRRREPAYHPGHHPGQLAGGVDVYP